MERITVTIDKELLDWILDKVKEGKYANISHAVRYAIKKLMEEENQ